MNDDMTLEDMAVALVEAATAKGVTIATAESCTGGLVAGLITEISGSSAVLDRGFVTYSNAAKVDMLGVEDELLEPGGPGAVSEAVATEMAEGALANSKADITVSITGIAGPTGGSDTKPVGLVWFACASRFRATLAISMQFANDGRAAIRANAVATAIGLLLDAVEDAPNNRS